MYLHIFIHIYIGAYYNYELAGVVVHTGTADSGHYYAYIKDTNNSLESGRSLILITIS
jgi:ubiquitin C-terminal hydrolase